MQGMSSFKITKTILRCESVVSRFLIKDIRLRYPYTSLTEFQSFAECSFNTTCI